MKRVLIITYYWPPTGGSGVQRWVKFCKYLPSFGWQPVIYTPLNPEQLARDESLLADIPECAEILKTSILEPYELYRRLLGKRSSEVNPVSSSAASLPKRISLWIRGNLFIPDPRISWRAKSIKFLSQYLRQHPVDAVITTGPPQSMHLIGLGLKKRLGVKWLADFRDPWTEMFYYKHLHLSKAADRRHHQLERRVLESADGIIAVSPLVRDDFAAAIAKFVATAPKAAKPAPSTPVYLITNGFDDDDFNTNLSVNLDANSNADFSSATKHIYKSETVESPQTTKAFRIVHTGLFASDGNPLQLWAALSELCQRDKDFRDKLEIRLAGKTDEAIIKAIEEAGLSDNLVNLGYLPHEQVVKEQSFADILILPLRQEPEYAKVLPGKIFEYLAARRPVLGIGQSRGAAAMVLDKSGAGAMYEWEDINGIINFILSPKYEPKDIEQYSRKALTAQLVDLLEKCHNKNER